MKYWHFTNWEPAPLEGALKSRVAVAIAAYENGDKNAIAVSCFKNCGSRIKKRGLRASFLFAYSL